MYCNECGTAGDPKEKSAGHFWIELLLWIQLLLWAVTASIVLTLRGDFTATLLVATAPLSYSLWRVFRKTKVCSHCGSSSLISARSPVAVLAQRVRD